MEMVCDERCCGKGADEADDDYSAEILQNVQAGFGEGAFAVELLVEVFLAFAVARNCKGADGEYGYVGELETYVVEQQGVEP